MARAHVRFSHFEWADAGTAEFFDCLAHFETPDAFGQIVEGTARWARIDPKGGNAFPDTVMPAGIDTKARRQKTEGDA